MSQRGAGKDSRGEKILIVDGFWGRENQAFLRVWPPNRSIHEYMSSTDWISWVKKIKVDKVGSRGREE